MGDNYTFSQQGIRNLRENLRIVLPVIETQSKEIEHWKAGMKIVEKDKNNHIERLDKEIEHLKYIIDCKTKEKASKEYLNKLEKE